jgi:hypothetical protein
MSATPKDLFGNNYTATSTSITLNLADLFPLGELTASEADPTTGNGVKVAYAIIKTMTDKLSDMTTPPTRISSFEGSYTTNQDGTVSRTYTQTFDFAVGDVADEPVDVSSPSSSYSSSASSSSGN